MERIIIFKSLKFKSGQAQFVHFLTFVPCPCGFYAKYIIILLWLMVVVWTLLFCIYLVSQTRYFNKTISGNNALMKNIINYFSLSLSFSKNKLYYNKKIVMILLIVSPVQQFNILFLFAHKGYFPTQQLYNCV